MSRNEFDNFSNIVDIRRGVLKNVMERMGLSKIAYNRILKVALTISDLDCSEVIGLNHLAEAIQLKVWAG